MFAVEAAGRDIGGRSDEFHFVYQVIDGDVEITARVDQVTAADPLSKAGLMIRGSLAADAPNGYIFGSASKGSGFNARRKAGGSTAGISSQAGGERGWIRLVRAGKTVTAYSSPDGTRWTARGKSDLAIGARVYVGLAVTSRTDSKKMTRALIAGVHVQSSTLPSPMQSADIGEPGVAGRATHAAGTYRVFGAGADIWDAADEFHFAYQPVTGDIDVRVRVKWVADIHRWSKAGVMIRESLAPGSRHAVAVASSGMGYAFQRRADTNGLSDSTEGPKGQTPGWVRLVRRGAMFEAFQSFDGKAWTLMGSDAIPMNETVYVGLAVTSHDRAHPAEGVFDNLVIEETDASPNAEPSVSITSPATGETFTSPARVTITADAADADGAIARVDFIAGNTLIGSDTTAPYSVEWASVPPGQQTLTAYAFDDQGASTRSAPVSITVTGDAGDPPAIELTSPADRAVFPAPATLTLAASVSQANVSRVEFFVNDLLVGADVTAPYTVPMANLPAGTYAIVAVAYDGATGIRSASPSRTITVGGSGEPAPGDTRMVVFTASVDHKAVTKYVLEIFEASADPATARAVVTSDLGKPAPDAASEISVDRTALFTALKAGNYIATVRAENSGGFNRSTPVAFTR